MTALRFPGILLLTGVLGLAGCMRYQQAPLYQLDSGDIRVPVAEQGIAVLLGPVAVADYLQRDALLQRQADGSLTAAEDARWAGSLAADIDQQLLRQLASRLDSQRLVLAPGAAGFVPQVRLGLSITRLDSGPQRPAVLDAQWRLAGVDGKLLDGRLVRLEEAHSGTIVDQVRAQSLVLQQLIEQLAVAIETHGTQVPPVVAPAPVRKPAPIKPAPPAPPRIPVVEPMRGEGEVFRF
ncbi:MAG: ABC-type transport auxiliary lipoprotein family protein [Pseudomonas sp.]|uniref:PqiC family protein n=1 Tax=Pseudomonas sp. TaxID=306 RepID=UPI002726211F|nr:ABC-type transport auxiliary lipoprotein family protein [Pseudomonas sp.]MDO9616662.1 ABC-type transport auxiliary lipoprotein family protein [Pseudomonas sp.]MDP2445264.1 ABC-type transport auxiliary lipoprotein family protein [Pseudomonas sp.]MDZ4335997.1 ABC-type transport auxiliary lipoprotein family protein [Pseudomonas sp.]